MPQPIVKAKIGNQTFGVTEDQARAFARAWDQGGIKAILDETSVKFATAFANIAMKSALEDPKVQMVIFQHVYNQLKAAKTGQPQAEVAVPAQANTEPTSSPAKSLITLTDA